MAELQAILELGLHGVLAVGVVVLWRRNLQMDDRLQKSNDRTIEILKRLAGIEAQIKRDSE